MTATVVVEADDVRSGDAASRIAALQDRGQGVGLVPARDIESPTATTARSPRSTSRPPATAPTPPSTDALDEVRDEIVPATVGRSRATTVNVSGDAAQLGGLRAISSNSRLPLIFAFVFGLAFLLLLVTFRSIVIPIKAILLNLLSVGAAYGVLVLVFQDGHGESLLGFTSNGGVASWLPLFLFVILFGLSMDYHVFILSRVRELYDGGMSTERGRPRTAISTTAGTVTSAALVMVGVFAVFATLSFIDFKELGRRPGRRGPDRRDDHPRRAAAGVDEGARRLELVPAELARVAAPRRLGDARICRTCPGRCARSRGAERAAEARARAGLMALIEVQHLTKHFGPVHAVDDLSFEIETGTITGFLGPNGSGKTTTLRSLLGLVTPTSGTATISGRPYGELDDPLHEVGVMLEASAHPGRTARNHLRSRGRRGPLPRSRVDELLDLVALDRGEPQESAVLARHAPAPRARHGPARRSRDPGPRRARERPRPGGDPLAARLPEGLAPSGRTILLSSHVLAEVAQTVDEVVVISKGELVAHAPLEELTANGNTGRVRLRSPELARLTQVLTDGGMQTHPNGDDVLTVSGASQEAIGQLAFDNRIVLYEIAGEGSSLEDVFLHLTTPDEEVAP